MKAILHFFLFFSLLLLFPFCSPLDFKNPGDTRSQAALNQLLWQEYIRPRSVCDATTFVYEPSYRSVTVKEALTPIQILQTKDKAIYVFGIGTFNPEKNLGTFSGTEDTGSSRNAMLFKFTETGVVEWSRTLGVATSAGNHVGLLESDSGVYLAFSASSSVGSPINAFTTPSSNVAVFHMAKDGSILWNTYFGVNSGNNKAYSIAKLSGGDLIVSGESNTNGISTFPGSILKLSATIVQNSAFVMRLRATGTPVWAHFFGGATAGNIRSAERVAVSSNDTITTFGFEREPLDSAYSKFVQNHTGSIPRKEFLVAQFDADGQYLRHTFLLTQAGQTNPILPLPVESEVPNEMLVASITNAEFQGLDSVRARNYQGSADQFLVKFNSTLNVSYVTYLGGPQSDPGSIYSIFQDVKKEGFFTFSPYLNDPGYGPGYNGSPGLPTLGLVRVDPLGKIVEYGFRGETGFNVPFTMTNSCDGGMLLGYYVGDSIDSSASSFAKFRLTKVRPTIPIFHNYSNPFFTFPGK